MSRYKSPVQKAIARDLAGRAERITRAEARVIEEAESLRDFYVGITPDTGIFPAVDALRKLRKELA